MSEIQLHREHTLGLAKARQVARQWAEQVEQKYDMACTVVAGQGHDVVEFTRPGCKGTLKVAADHFDLQVRLGLLLGVFSGTIRSGIERQLDDLLAQQPPHKPAASKTAAGKTAAGKTAPRKAAAKKVAAKKKPKPV